MPPRPPEPAASTDGRVRPEPHGEALVEFAYGTAHDFSNFLQIIMGFAEFMKSQHKDNPEVMECVEEILTASQRAKAMVGDLLVVGRRNPPHPEPVDVRPVLQQAVERAQGQVNPAVRIDLAVDSAPQSAILEPSSLERMLLLLCAFAATGMPEGGVIRVRAAADAERLRVSVQQPGEGVDADTARRLCEPFYMKRTHHRGTGLELAVVASLTEQQGGAVEVESAPGQGVTVYLSFPTARKDT